MNKLGAKDVQRLASLALQEGAQGATELANVGHRGARPGNFARDIKRMAMRGCEVPKPYMVKIPVHVMSHGDVHLNQIVEHPVLLPHEVLEYLVTAGIVTIDDVVDMAARTDQTLHVQKTKFCAEYGVPDKLTIPIGFHGDGVPFQKSTHKHSCTEVFSWNFLCDRDGKRYMFCNINKDFLCLCGCHGRCTMDKLMEVFVWSMHVLLDGKHPNTRHDGGWLDPMRLAKKKHTIGIPCCCSSMQGRLAMVYPDAWIGKLVCREHLLEVQGKQIWQMCMVEVWANSWVEK